MKSVGQSGQYGYIHFQRLQDRSIQKNFLIFGSLCLAVLHMSRRVGRPSSVMRDLKSQSPELCTFFMKNCLNLIFILSFRKEDEVEPRQSRPEHFLGVGYSEIGVMETIFLFNFSVFTRGCLLNFKMVTYVLGETP